MVLNKILYWKLKESKLLGHVCFEIRAIGEINEWCTEDNDEILDWIIELLIDIKNNGDTSGIGRPELLVRELKGWYSRTITFRHRLVYKTENNIIKILSCRQHY